MKYCNNIIHSTLFLKFMTSLFYLIMKKLCIIQEYMKISKVEKLCMHSFDLTCNIVRQKELTIGVIDSCGGGSGTVVF